MRARVMAQRKEDDDELPAGNHCCTADRNGAGIIRSIFHRPRVSAVPGGIVTFTLSGGPDERPWSPTPQAGAGQLEPGSWMAIVGIPLDTEPGEYHVEVKQPGANERQLAFKVAAKEYAVQRLKVPPNQVNLSQKTKPAWRENPKKCAAQSTRTRRRAGHAAPGAAGIGKALHLVRTAPHVQW